MEGWTCPACQARGGARRDLCREAPRCLAVQLLRFAAGKGWARKLCNPVDWEDQLDWRTSSGALGLARYEVRAAVLHRGQLAG